MSELLEKSTQSLEAAKLLVKINYYSSTVNRSYYACLQYLMYILFEKLNKDKVQFYNEVQQSKNGTHSLALKLVGNELAKKDYQDYKWFQKELPEFKNTRVVADYYIDTITQEDGITSIIKSEAIINLLKKNFK